MKPIAFSIVRADTLGSGVSFLSSLRRVGFGLVASARFVSWWSRARDSRASA